MDKFIKIETALMAAAQLASLYSQNPDLTTEEDFDTAIALRRYVNGIIIELLSAEELNTLKKEAQIVLNTIVGNFNTRAQILIMRMACRAIYYFRFLHMANDNYWEMAHSLFVLANLDLFTLELSQDKVLAFEITPRELTPREKYLFNFMALVGYESINETIILSEEIKYEFEKIKLFYQAEISRVNLSLDDEIAFKKYKYILEDIANNNSMEPVGDWVLLTCFVLGQMFSYYGTTKIASPQLELLIIESIEKRMKLHGLIVKN